MQTEPFVKTIRFVSSFAMRRREGEKGRYYLDAISESQTSSLAVTMDTPLEMKDVLGRIHLHKCSISFHSGSAQSQNVCRRTTIELALVVDHEHNFPLKHILIIYQSNADARYMVRRLHELELLG